MGKMNYIKEVNAFHNRLETNPLSTAAANLWHVLMHVNNRAGWLEEFTVAVSVLCAKASLTESTFKRVRAELQEKGYIRYQSRGGNQAAIYQIISLVTFAGSVEKHVDGSLDHNLDHNVNGNVDPLVKQNKMKQNNTATTTTDAATFFQGNFGAISPYVAMDLNDWLNNLGEPLVLHAMKRALERAKANWGYVKGILQAWVKKGITSVDLALAEEKEFHRSQGGKKGSHPFAPRTGSQEVVPDWFKEQKRQEKLKRKQEEVMRAEPDHVVDRAEMELLLARISSGRRVVEAG